MARRRADWRLGRWAAKTALAAVGAGPAAPAGWPDVELLAADDGAPEPHASSGPLPWSVSWSHRAGRVVAAVVAWPATVGVDLERLEPRSDAFVREWFEPDEQAWVGTDRVRRANLLWTAKEAAAKVAREGLRLDVRALRVEVTELAEDEAGAGGGWAPLVVTGVLGRAPLEGWWRARDGFVATVLTDPPAGPPTEVGVDAAVRGASAGPR